MRQIHCPFIGLQEDPSTALDFPSDGNFCHKARPIAPVKNEYQERYCLTLEHTACPIYQSAKPQPLPLAIVAPSFLRSKGKRTLAVLAIPIALALLVVVGVAGSPLLSRMNFLGNPIPRTGGETNSGGNGLFNLLLTPSITPLSVSTALPNQTLRPNCAMPKGWMAYTVNPTDSLMRLSVVYGASIEQLQKANCMGKNTVILPGQIIYVPFVPTSTPTKTLTPVALKPTATNTQPPARNPTDTQAPEEEPTATFAPTSTPAVPTSFPSNTPFPTAEPTQTAEPPTPTNAPEPTKKPKPTKAPTSTEAPQPSATPALPQATEVPSDPPTPTVAPAFDGFDDPGIINTAINSIQLFIQGFIQP